jgi:MFS family permease
MAVGQYLLNIADPKTLELFIVTSLLISSAVVPVALASRPAPKFGRIQKVSPKELFNRSPLGVYGIFAIGMSGSALFSIGPVYAAQEGFTLPQISTFMAAVIVGGVVMQFPIGTLSDRFDRRKVLIAVSGAASLMTFVALFLSSMSVYVLFFAMALLGGAALTLYGLCSSHTNDHLEREQIVGASATIIMVNGAGAILGPLSSAALMNALGPWAWYLYMGLIYASIALFGVYRSFRRPSVPLDHQSHYIVQPSPSAAMVMQQAETYDNELKEKQNLS